MMFLNLIDVIIKIGKTKNDKPSYELLFQKQERFAITTVLSVKLGNMLTRLNLYDNTFQQHLCLT